MIDKKLRPGDDFWNVQAQEKQFIDGIDRAIAQTASALALAKRVSALRSAAGFQDYVQAVEDLRQASISCMLASDDPREVMDYRARVNALGDVTKLLRDNQQSVDMLASRLDSLQNQRSSVVRPDGKVATGGSPIS